MHTVSRLCLLLLTAELAAAEVSLQSLYDNHRWFDLREATLGKNVHPLYRGAVASAFNDCKQAEKHLKATIRAAASPGEVEEAHSLLAWLYARMGRSREVARHYEQVLKISPERSDIRSLLELCWAFSRYPDQSLGRNRRTTLRWTMERTGLTIPVSVNGKTVRWIVDTGMNFSTVSESEARMLGISVQKVGYKAGDLAGGRTAINAGVANSLRFGEIEVRNVPLFVLPDSQPPVNELPPGQRGIIGLPVLIAFQTLRWNADGTFEIGPALNGQATEPNLCFDDLNPVVRVEHGGRHLDFIFDTGNAGGTQLWQRYAKEFSDIIKERGVKNKEWIAQIGSSGDREVVTIPELRLRVGGLETALRPAHVFSKPVGNEHHYGLLGLDLLGQAREVLIDFRSMSVRLR